MSIKKINPYNVYYARDYELTSSRQLTLPISLREDSRPGFVAITVPDKWVKGQGSRIVSLFYKTGKDIVCPHFWELKAWTGCPFQCSYCYLQGTFRGANRKAPRLKDLRTTAKYLKMFLKWADNIGLKTLLNTGEIADSLGVPSYVDRFLEIAIPILYEHSNHKVLFLTKAGTNHIKVLEKVPRDLRERFIVSFSINPQPIVDKYEKGTASAEDRIEAARLSQEMGFEVRIRIDPMIPIESWILYYIELVRELLDKVRPSRITIGSLRALVKTRKYAKDRSWLRFVSEKSAWGLRVEGNLRLRMYELVIEALKEYGYSGSIALCKEPLDTWLKLHGKGLLNHPGRPGIWENVMCNCKL